MFDTGPLLAQAARLHALAAELAAGIDADVSGAQAVELLAEVYAAGRHHHLVHEGGWTLTIADDPQRTPLFTPPHGGPPHTGQRRPLITSPKQRIPTRPCVTIRT